MTTGWGLVPVPGGSRRAHLREWRRESLWLWPAVAALAAWAAGDLAARDLHSFTLHQGFFPTDLDDARTLLSTIAAALLTFTGVVFSITLVALQMASTQYSPRVLRTFVRKPVTKLALATFIATFVYALDLLARVGSVQCTYGPTGRRCRCLSARDGVGDRVRFLRQLHSPFHACHLCDRGGLR